MRPAASSAAPAWWRPAPCGSAWRGGTEHCGLRIQRILVPDDPEPRAQLVRTCRALVLLAGHGVEVTVAVDVVPNQVVELDAVAELAGRAEHAVGDLSALPHRGGRRAGVAQPH